MAIKCLVAKNKLVTEESRFTGFAKMLVIAAEKMSAENFLTPIFSEQLIKRVDSLQIFKNNDDIYTKYRDIFEGLWEIPGLCNIELQENAKPVIQCNRKDPFSIHETLKTTLEKLEQKNIIEKVNYPTDWYNRLMIGN